MDITTFKQPWYAVEDEFEPLEKMINDTVSNIDRQIQHEIDVARGK